MKTFPVEKKKSILFLAMNVLKDDRQYNRKFNLNNSDLRIERAT